MSADETAAIGRPDWAEALHERIAEALCDAWNSEHASGPRDASVPAEWEQEAYAVLDTLGLVEVEVETRFEGPGHMAVDVPYVCPVDWRYGTDDIKPSTVRLFMLAPDNGGEGDRG